MILSEFIKEEATKNKHLEHIEEEILNRGREGAEYSMNVMMQFADMLRGRSNKKLKVTVKWDGAPALVCGTDPESGKFFIATKGAFAKTPKLAFTQDDVQRLFPDYLWSKVGPCLEYLPKLGIKGVVQGDFMFNEEMKSTVEIDGKEYVTFKPNTITYAFPTDSSVGKKILKAKVGIVFHTGYEGGDTLADMSAVFGVDVSGYKQTSDVWFDDATFKDLTGNVLLTSEEKAQVKQDLADAMAAYKAVPSALYQQMADNAEFIVWFKRTINEYIRQNKLPGDPDQFLNDFVESYKVKMQNEINKLSSQDPERPAVKARMIKIEQQVNLINRNRKGLASVLRFIKEISNLKLLFVSKLNSVESMAQFYREPDGSYTATSPEGYVAVDHIGNAVKFVDRLDFSRRNFMAKDFG